MGEDLAVLQAEFPAFRIWEEQMPGRVRYVARSRTDGVNPHTVIAADLDEMRGALQPSLAVSSDERSFSTAEPNIARMYAYWLQGKDHYAADRAAAGRVLEQFPEVAEVARANRSFVTSAVRYLADQGITQFIDIGSGLPASPNVHETARSITPGARVVYVDLDPVVLAHARALLAVDENVGVVAGDIRDPAGLLRAVASTGVIDSIRPTGVLLTSLLHFLTAAEALRDVERTDPLLCQLVAHHSCAHIEAAERGLADDLFREFKLAPRGLSDALIYCDMTTGPQGQPMTVEERFAEIRYRYGLNHVVTHALARSGPEMVASADRITRKLTGRTSARRPTQVLVLAGVR